MNPFEIKIDGLRHTLDAVVKTNYLTLPVLEIRVFVFEPPPLTIR